MNSDNDWVIVLVNVYTHRKWFGKYLCGTVHCPDSEKICRYRKRWIENTYHHLIEVGMISIESVCIDDYPFAEHPDF
jgi:hypothetical protein